LTDRSNHFLPTALLAGMLVLAGCGVKGPLEPPVGAENTATPNPLQTTVTPDTPGPTVTSTPTQTAASTSARSETSKSFKSKFTDKAALRNQRGRSATPQKRTVPITGQNQKPDQPFFLDKLL
jgi:predicted small lipoprotein YifL